MKRYTPPKKDDGKGNCRLCGKPLKESADRYKRFFDRWVAAITSVPDQKNEDLSLADKRENIRQGNEFASLSGYVRSFDGVSRQLEATYNLMRYLKRIAIELQPKTQGQKGA